MPTSAVDPAVLVGLETPDDAGVYRIGPDLALVQTVDFFTPIVDDPFDWGRIAAANALSDVYAMGGTPITALNLVGWPRSLDFALLGRVLEGAGKVCSAAGVAVVGGHSVDDPEPKFGLAVTGTVHPDRVVRKDTGRPGDVLVLTKPIGTGIISTAIKEGKAPPAAAAAAISAMATLNRAAADAMLAHGASAATDVTGFGLLGHLSQMLGDHLSVDLEVAAVPLLEGAAPLALEGLIPGGSRRNREAIEARVEVDRDMDEGVLAVLFDAQTSGGLLIAVAPEGAEALLGTLRAEGVSDAAVIGRLSAGDGTMRMVGP